MKVDTTKSEPNNQRFARTLCTVIALLLLLSCEAATTFPDQSEITRVIGERCKVVSIAEMQLLPEQSPGFKRVAYPYQADCVPEGGAIAHRVRGLVTFEQREERIGKVWGAGVGSFEPDALAPDGRPSRNVALPMPNCDALVQRMINEVLPCLQKQLPEQVPVMQTYIDRYRQMADVRVNTPNAPAAAIQRDTECLEYWRAINRQLPTGTAPGACGLKD